MVDSEYSFLYKMKTAKSSKMKYFRKHVRLVLTMLLVNPFKAIGQNTESNDTSKNKLIHAARKIMAAAGTCALITIDEEGIPKVRAMDPFILENDFTVWFGTNAKSRKVNQINNDARVTLYYLNSDASG